jgi:hypothetical protein
LKHAGEWNTKEDKVPEKDDDSSVKKVVKNGNGKELESAEAESSFADTSFIQVSIKANSEFHKLSISTKSRKEKIEKADTNKSEGSSTTDVEKKGEKKGPGLNVPAKSCIRATISVPYSRRYFKEYDGNELTDYDAMGEVVFYGGVCICDRLIKEFN